MCVLFLAVDAHPRYRLVLAGNRDEAHVRPTAPLARWADAPHVLAGRDLEAGGTWLGVTESGRWATVTNVRDPKVGGSPPASVRPDRLSRGALVAGFLRGSDAPADYAAQVQAERDAYNGFNLLVGDGADVWIASSRRGAGRLAPGLYGLSNDTLDTPWPKITRGRAAFAEALRPARLDPADLIAFLADETLADDEDLPETGVGRDLERALSPLFIRGPHYGTRASTVLLLDRNGGGTVVEQSWGPDGVAGPLTTDALRPPTP